MLVLLRSVVIVVVLQWCTAVVYAVDTNIALINLTPYDWKQSKAPHAYQVSDWTSSFASTIQSNHVAKAKASIDNSLSPKDSAAEVSYQVTDDSGSTIEIRLRVDSFVQGSTLPSAEHIEVALQGISTIGNSQGNTVNVGFNDGSWTPVIFGGKKNSLVGNNPPLNWMYSNIDHIGCLTLESLMIPGSHDAGMSEFQIVQVNLADAASTITQTKNVYEQLRYGARYFDIRPSVWKGKYYTGHWTKVANNYQGGLGQSIADIIDNVNQFTATANMNELVILYLSHTASVDNNYAPFTRDEQNEVLYELYKGLNHLYLDSSGQNLTTIKLSTFIQNSPAVVVVCDECDVSFLQSKGFFGRGFFAKSQFPTSDSYADTTDVSSMRQDQYSKLQAWASNRRNSLFLLSWTMTMSDVGSAVGGFFGLDHLVDRADYANSRLYEVGAAPPTAGLVQWVDWANSIIPNIVLIDNVKDGNLAALLVAMNRYYYDCHP